jgi:hypothetical protein
LVPGGRAGGAGAHRVVARDDKVVRKEVVGEAERTKLGGVSGLVPAVPARPRTER